MQETFRDCIYFHPLPVERFLYMTELDSIASYANYLQINVLSASVFRSEMERFFLEKLQKLDNEKSRKKLISECLRNKGLVPKHSKETQIKYILNILDAEFRWSQLIESKEKEALKYIRFNPERGKISKRQKYISFNKIQPTIKANTANDSKMNEIVETPAIERLCRQCNYPCPIITRSFCSLSCLHLYKIRSRSKYVRRCLFIRDKGICDLCGLDTEKIRQSVHKIIRQMSCETVNLNKKEWWKTFCDNLPLKVHNVRITRRGTVPRGCFWHADHILAVSQGGGNALLHGYRTLCVSCHQNMTRLLRAKPRFLKFEKPLKNEEKPYTREKELLTPSETLVKPSESSLLERIKLQRSQRRNATDTTCVREKLQKFLLVTVPSFTKEEEAKNDR